MRLFEKKKTYICFQIAVSDKTPPNVNVFSIVRRVEAYSQEEAIVKFAIGTDSVTAVQKLPIECIELSNLTKA